MTMPSRARVGFAALVLIATAILSTDASSQSRVLSSEQRRACLINENGISCEEELAILVCVSPGDELVFEVESDELPAQELVQFVLSRTPTVVHDPFSKDYEVTIEMTVDGWSHAVSLSPSHGVWSSAKHAEWLKDVQVKLQLLGESPSALGEQRVGRIHWPLVLHTVGSTTVEAPSTAWLLITVENTDLTQANGLVTRVIETESIGLISIEPVVVSPLMQGSQVGWQLELTAGNYGGRRADYQLMVEDLEGGFLRPPVRAVTLDGTESSTIGVDLWAAQIMDVPPPWQVPSGSCRLLLVADTGRIYDQMEVALE
jgi:hypothetical protein